MLKELIIKANEKVVLPVLWLGKEKKLDYNIVLSARGAEVTVLLLLLGRKGQILKLDINIYHRKPDTKSKIIVKGALTDKAEVDFNGLVKIEPGATGTNAWLAAHLLLLSDQAKGRAVPSLEISENDIKAGHATTVGKVNDLELFYLMSRGLSEETAKQLIVQGFFESILSEFPESLAKKAGKELKYL